MPITHMFSSLRAACPQTKYNLKVCTVQLVNFCECIYQQSVTAYTSLTHPHVGVCSQTLPNMTTMLQQMTLSYAAGQVLWSYHTLMLLCFLLDPQISGTTPPPDPTLDPNASAKAALGLQGLSPLLDLVNAFEEEERTKEEKLTRQLSVAGSNSASDSDSETADGFSTETSSSTISNNKGGPEQATAASLGPLLIRMLNGEAALLTGIAEELQALQWLLGQLQNQPALPPTVSPSYKLLHYVCEYLHMQADMPWQQCFMMTESMVDGRVHTTAC